MLKIVLIRHSKTAGNLQGRYIGRTDEPLCKEGRKLLKSFRYPKTVQKVYVSPMLRCQETAELIYPALPKETVDDFRELDFGIFENKNHAELDGNPDYQAWVDSSGTMRIPGGEDGGAFRKRCRDAFSKVLLDAAAQGLSEIALVVHGGTIMSIMEGFAEPYEEYYHWQVKNGRGYVTELKENGKLSVVLKLPLC